MQLIKLTLPKPPSINHLYGNNRWGGKYIKAEKKAWFTEAGWIIKSQVKLEKPIKECSIIIILHTIRMDLDNILKATLDCLAQNNLIENDRYVMEMYLRKEKVKHAKDEKVEIEIIEYDANND
jgi:Holliday junction resolvase RusA-like endonuclease